MSTRERDRSQARRAARKAAPPSATAKHLHISARKLRALAPLIRGKLVSEALLQLAFIPRATARPLRKLLDSAVANADLRGGFDLDKLFVKRVKIDQGPEMRRYLSRSMGRAYPYNRHTAHVTLVVDQKKVQD
jgi:large subunit ribosomal protein L22